MDGTVLLLCYDTIDSVGRDFGDRRTLKGTVSNRVQQLVLLF